MTAQEWIDQRIRQDDITYLRERGFEILIVPNTSDDEPYIVYLFQGNNCEAVSAPYGLEQIVNILKMAEKLASRQEE